MLSSSNKPSHLKALLKKNLILRKRRWCVAILELIVPAIFVGIMSSIRAAVPIDDIPQTTYYDNPEWKYSFDGTLNNADEPFLAACTSSKNSAMIGLSPEGDTLISALKNVFENDLGLKTKYFQNVEEINDFTSRGDYGTSPELTLCFAVVVNKNNQDDKFEYSLMFNASQPDDSDDIPKTSEPRIKALARENLDSLQQYGTSGFLAVQNLIDNLILRQATSDLTATIQSDVTSVTVEAHKTDELAEGMRGQARFYFDIPLLLPYLRMLNGIVSEKEKRIREGMKIMGLTNKAFYLSWFITYSIIFTIVSLLVSVVATLGIFKLSSFGLVFLWHWEFTMCVMALAFFISIFFNKAKQANVAGFVIALLLSFFQYLGNRQGAGKAALIGCSIPPQASIGLSVDHILSLEATQLGLTSETVGLEILDYRLTYHYVIMVIDTLVLLLLGIYLDQVLPSEFGIRKHPLFCLMRKKRSLKKRVSQSLDDQNYNLVPDENPENFEETDPTLKIQDETNESVVVQNLRKVYDSTKVAVDGVSFSMYNNQIFALLGHNGAGKTTTISMITGLFGSTQGTTKVFGMDNQTQIDDIRKIIGVCPQHDILFDDMTVKEHLELFAVFKGVDSKLIRQEVEKTIEDIGLADKRDYLSKNLSGGQKRKLSIGIAFIGGSRFIILDEPSSGMDTSARRKLWEMLKNYKHNRVILLTTHFMDEADYLGDRIGIMGEGKLKCLGRPLFLKSRFGAGYNLTLVKKDINDPSKPIKELVLSLVEGGKVLSDISAEISFQLPLEAAPKFDKLFDALDKNLDKLRINSYGISATTLEEVFLNVAKIGRSDTELHKREPIQSELEDADLSDFSARRDGIKGDWNIFRTHFQALVMKRVHYLKRDKRGLVCEIFLPILVVIAGILLGRVEFNPLGSPLPLVDNLYEYQFQVGYNAFVPPAGALVYQNFLDQFNPIDFELSQKVVADIAQFDQVLYESQGKDIIRSTVNVFGFYMDTFDTTTNSYQYTAFINTRAQEGSAFALNKINNAILRSTPLNQNKEIIVTVSPFEKTKGTEVTDKIMEGIIFSFVFSMGMSFIPASIITFIVKEREINAKHQQIVSGVSLMAYWISNYFVDIIKYLIPAIVNSLLAMAFNAEALIEGDKLGGLWAIFILYGFGMTSFVYLLSFCFKDYGTAQVASFFINFCTGFIGSVIVTILRLFKSTMAAAKIMHWIFRILPTFSMTYGLLNLSNAEAYAAVENQTSPLNIYDVNLVLGDILYLIVGAIVYLLMVFVIEKLKNVQSLGVMLSRENKVPYLLKEADDDVKREELEVEKSDNHTYSIKVDKLRKVYALGHKKYKVAVDRVSFGVRNGECFALLGVNGAGKTTTFKILSGDYVQTSGNAYINGYSIPDQMEEARKDIGYCPQFDALLEHLTAKEHLYLYAAIKGIPIHLRQRLVEKQLIELNLKQYENIPAGTYSGGNKRKLSVAIAMIGNPSVVFLDEPSTGMDPEARRAMWNVISRISRERKQSSVILTTHSMEEAEALSTKMGIMVSGNLKCLGTSQHIKSKFGGGYEIEVKLNLPSQDQINNTLRTLNCTADDDIERERVEQILEDLGLTSLLSEISEEGSGSAIDAELKKGKVSVSFVIEWALIEANGERLKANFGEMNVLEHFQSFFRFKSTNKFSIGDFFGGLEANKTSLNILHYSIRQSTIEQIFNKFATEEVQVQDGIHIDLKISTTAKPKSMK